MRHPVNRCIIWSLRYTVYKLTSTYLRTACRCTNAQTVSDFTKIPYILTKAQCTEIRKGEDNYLVLLVFSSSLMKFWMFFDKFLLAVESRDLSQADKSIMRVSSFPNWVMGNKISFSVSQHLRPELSATLHYVLNPPRFTSQQKNWEKCLLFNLY